MFRKNKSLTQWTGRQYAEDMARAILDRRALRIRLLRRVRETGKIDECWEGICSKSALYNYLKRHPEYKEELETQKELFRLRMYQERPDLWEKAVAQIERYLKDGDRQTWKREFYTVDEDGTKRLTGETVSEVIRGTPKWVLDKLEPPKQT